MIFTVKWKKWKNKTKNLSNLWERSIVIKSDSNNYLMIFCHSIYGRLNWNGIKEMLSYSKIKIGLKKFAMMWKSF